MNSFGGIAVLSVPNRGIKSYLQHMSEEKKLRYGWTSGCCATAAAKAALEALITGAFPDPADVQFSSGAHASFSLATTEPGLDYAQGSPRPE